MAELTENPADHEARRTQMSLALLGIALLVTFVLLVPIPFDGRFWHAIANLVHAPLFAAIVMVLSFVLGRQFAGTDSVKSILLRTITVAISVFTFGVVVELAQTVSGRSASIHDIISNGWGVIGGVLLYFALALWKYPDAAFSVFVLVSLAVGAFISASRDSAVFLYDTWSMQRNFPQLASFETELELQRFLFRNCSARQSELDVTDGNHSMEVLYAVDSYVTATMIEMLPDWSELRSFEIDVALDEGYGDKSLKFAIQIGSGENIVYRGKWTLYPGQPQHISVTRQALNRGTQNGSMDFSQIRYIDLAVVDPIEQVRLRFDSIRLTLNQPKTD